MKSTACRIVSGSFLWLSTLFLTLAAGCRANPITPTVEDTIRAETTSTTTRPTCQVEGVVYAQAPYPGNELAEIRLTLIHSSNCSPTQGQFHRITNTEGSFSFPEIFYHDTDRVQIQIEQEGYASWMWDSAGQYCYYCTCFYESI